MGQLLGVELFKTRKRMMVWILLAVLVGFMILDLVFSYLAVTSISGHRDAASIESLRIALQFPKAFTLVLAGTQGIGIILLIILAASLTGSEYGWATVTQTIGRKGTRSLYIGSKLISLIIVALILVLIGLAVGTALSAFNTYKLAGQINWDFFTLSFAGSLIKMFIWTAFTIMIYALLAVLFATVGRSVVAGIGGALGYYFIESILVAVLTNSTGWTHRIPDYLIGHNIGALLRTGVERNGPFSSSNTVPSGLHATLILTIYAVVFLGTILYVFKRQDLNA